MGVPAFFRWLSRKYPSVVINAVEKKPQEVDEVVIPIDCTEANPNFQEFDNLYLDMNGIIHPCTHPEDRPAPKTEEEMFTLIFEYIDRIFAIVRPRRLLYMAIDGVAPRAKMNQQRSRRFRASKEAYEKAETIRKVRDQLEREGIPLPPESDNVERFDSNCITPGTPFMSRLADALNYYIHLNLKNDPAWSNIMVVLSDASVPGEGEHKIMDFIRSQRASSSHDPNTVHCLCGADADLIMLGLATHEPHFYIIREEFVPNQPKPCEICGQYGHDLNDCKGLVENVPDCQSNPLQKDTSFIFIRLPVLREYLERELNIPNSPIPFDLERAIDDWVFMCFFVGNDFLPHLPSLEIRENAIDRLINLYKDMVYTTRGYLTDAGDLHMDRVQIILERLGEVEDEIFQSRKMKEVHWERNKARRSGMRYSKNQPLIFLLDPFEFPQSGIPMFISNARTRSSAYDARVQAMDLHYSNQVSSCSQNTAGESVHNEEDSDMSPQDEVRLWETGWKERYYHSKFKVDGSNIEFCRKVAVAYVDGLSWVLKYYYQGCASWNWYFPYHYAPFASDFVRISNLKPVFDTETKPFKPLEQLMAVFPAASRSHVPKSWQILMSDTDSEIVDFYPLDFHVDLNGKRFAWQGVALLPFVDEIRLLDKLHKVEDTLNDFEKARNCVGTDRVFVGHMHKASKFLEELYNSATHGVQFVQIDALLTYGISLVVACDSEVCLLGNTYQSKVFPDQFKDIRDNSALVTLCQLPQFQKGKKFLANRLPGAVDPPKILKPGDWDETKKYHPQIGFTRNMPRASLGSPGHRMLSHHTARFHPYRRVPSKQYRHAVTNQYGHGIANQHDRRAANPYIHGFANQYDRRTGEEYNRNVANHYDHRVLDGNSHGSIGFGVNEKLRQNNSVYISNRSFPASGNNRCFIKPSCTNQSSVHPYLPYQHQQERFRPPYGNRSGFRNRQRRH